MTKSVNEMFDIAWESIPADVSEALRQFIRQVREVSSLSGTYIGCPDGTRYGPLDFGTGYTFFYKDSNVEFCEIILPTLLAKASRSSALTIMLHELSHAWRQAAEWAKLGIRDADLAAEVSSAALDAEFQDSLANLLEQFLNQAE